MIHSCVLHQFMVLFVASKIVTEEEILAVWGKINQNLALMY